MENCKTDLTFSDVNEGWATARLGDVVSFSKGKGISKDDIVADGKTECIRYGELYTTYSEVIKVVASKTNIDKNELVLSEINDIIIPSSGETQIDIARSSCVLKNGVALGGDLNILKTKLDAIYLSYYLNSAKKQEIARMAQGISVVHLYASQLQNLIIHYPLSIVHSTKIATCLSSLDEVIAAHSQKLELLKDHKKGLMQNLFPQEGEKVPKFRFKEFEKDGEWVEKKLGEVCKMQAGKFISASEIKDQTNNDFFPCYGGNGLRGYTNSFTHSGTYSLIGRQGALCGNVTLVQGYFHATEHAVVVTPETNIDTIWLYYVLELLNLNQYATGQAQPGLSVSNLEQVELYLPKKTQEQQKIASCLSSLDALITAQVEKIEQLQLHKKGLMQGLFPNPSASSGETIND
jgi:type I restriction enzyme, S subunit